MKNIKQKIKGVPKNFWIFLGIMLIGIFLRVYNFSDWLVFNPDQARDAMLVDDVLSDREAGPIIGPEVGNTHVGLGPWFYHLEILSAKFFGSEPWKLAIPDLIFSLLTIPLFYFFVRKYFAINLSLIMTFFVSLSYFMVRYSRFAFNPNSIPFFVLLFLLGVLYFLESDRKRGFLGATLIGIGIGVGMQLHVLLFFIMPTVIGFFFLWMILKRMNFWALFQKTGVIVLFIVLTNIGQINYELKHHGSNTNLFMAAVTDSTGGSKVGRNISMDLLCQTQANLHLISSLGNSEQCNFYEVYHRFSTKGLLGMRPGDNIILFFITLAVAYSLGGYILLFYFWRKEKDGQKKNFLALIGIYGLVCLIAMFPIIAQASLRYYIVSFFLPFIFLGIWVKFFFRIARFNMGRVVIMSLVVLAIFFQVQKIGVVFSDFKNYRASDSSYAIWGEVEDMANYISQNYNHSAGVYLAGKRTYFSRFYKPLLYATKKRGLDIQRGDKSEKIPVNGQVFYVQDTASFKKKESKTFMDKEIKNYKTFGNVTIINFEK